MTGLQSRTEHNKQTLIVIKCQVTKCLLILKVIFVKKITY